VSDDLIKRLGENVWTLDQAEDLIERLERQVDTMQDRLDTANKARADAVSWANTKQAKLAKAMEAFRLIAGFKGSYSFPFPETYQGYGSFAVVTAREALVELEGKDE
jgi:exonuclease VII small subunit